MTEQEWLDCTDPGRMISHLNGRRSSGRQPFDPERFRLFAIACCYRLWPLLEFGDQYAVQCLEIYARGKLREALLKARRFQRPAGTAASNAVSTSSGADYRTRMIASARNLASSVVWSATRTAPTKAAMGYKEAAQAIRYRDEADRHIPGEPEPAPDWGATSPAELAIQCDLLRDIFGNPFRLVAFDPAWRTDTAVSLARPMYEGREFSAMPILADAIQDAGCDNDDVLAHCRDPKGVHVRGCWVVDLVLGKA
jgi:hypothetical protein